MPADIITYAGVKKLKDEFQEQCIHSYGVVWKMKGGASGGTAHTAIGMVDNSLVTQAVFLNLFQIVSLRKNPWFNRKNNEKLFS